MASTSDKQLNKWSSYTKLFKIDDEKDSAICEVEETSFDDGDEYTIDVENAESYFRDEEEDLFVENSKNTDDENKFEDPRCRRASKKTASFLSEDIAEDTNDKSELVEYVLVLNNKSVEEEDGDMEHEYEEDINAVADDPDTNVKQMYTCKFCEYATEQQHWLVAHLQVHSNQRPFKCSVCEREFKTKAALLNHVNAHLGNKPHACKYCSMAFTTSGELMRHTRYKHTGEKPHRCTECDYSSVELTKLRRHMRCHTGERPYQCPHCTYASPDTFKLKRHLRIHTGEKPYECDICHVRFSQSNALKSHRLIHSVGEKPVFQCPYCPTTCGRKTDLRTHINHLHNSDKPIPCKRCGQNFPDRYSYKVHIKTHVGEKSFRYF